MLPSLGSASMPCNGPHGSPTAVHLDAGLQKVKRARFAASVRLLEDLDEAGVQYLLHHLPAWLQVSSCCLEIKGSIFDEAFEGLWSCGSCSFKTLANATYLQSVVN